MGQKYAEKMYSLADNWKEEWLTLVGGKVSCEAELCRDPGTQERDGKTVYKHTPFLEVGDLADMVYDGRMHVRSTSMAGCSNSTSGGVDHQMRIS